MLLPEDKRIATRAAETKNRMRAEGRREFGLIDGLVHEIAKALDSVFVTGDPHFRRVRGVRFIE